MTDKDRDPRARWQRAAWAGLQNRKFTTAIKPIESSNVRQCRILSRRLSNVVPMMPSSINMARLYSLQLPGAAAWPRCCLYIQGGSLALRAKLVASTIISDTLQGWEQERIEIEEEPQKHTAENNWSRLKFAVLSFPFEFACTLWATDPTRPFSAASFLSCLPLHCACSMSPPSDTSSVKSCGLYFFVQRPLSVINYSAAGSGITAMAAAKQILQMPNRWILQRLFFSGMGYEIYFCMQVFLGCMLFEIMPWVQPMARYTWILCKAYQKNLAGATAGVLAVMIPCVRMVSRDKWAEILWQIGCFAVPSFINAGLQKLSKEYYGEAPVAVQRRIVQQYREAEQAREESRAHLDQLLEEVAAEPLHVEVELPTDLRPLMASVAAGPLRQASISRRLSKQLSGGLARTLSSSVQGIPSASDGAPSGGSSPDGPCSDKLASDQPGTPSFPSKVYITNFVGENMTAINGCYELRGDCLVRPSYQERGNLTDPKEEGAGTYLRFLDDGTWNITMTAEDEKSVFAFSRDQAINPLDIKAPWYVLNRRLSMVGTWEAAPSMAIVPDVTPFLHHMELQVWMAEQKQKAEAENSTAEAGEHEYTLVVRRAVLVESSIQAVMAASAEQLLRGDLKVQFQGEEGLDYGGLFREWFDLLAQKLAVGQTQAASPHIASSASRDASERLAHLWWTSPDGTLLPIAHSKNEQQDAHESLKYFVAVGRLLALSLKDDVAFSLPLSILIYKCLVRRAITVEDLKQLDPDFFTQRLERLLTPGGAENMAELLGEPLTFMSAGTDWRPEPQPLVPDGESKEVTEENKHEYAVMLCEDYLIGGIRQEMQALVKGFWELIPLQGLEHAKLTAMDLQRLVERAAPLDVPALRDAAKRSQQGEEQFQWFFEVLEGFDVETQVKVIQFTTGSSKLPLAGAKALRPPFSVMINSGLANELLPTSHTCANMICIPAYPSKEILGERLCKAVSLGAGFGFM